MKVELVQVIGDVILNGAKLKYGWYFNLDGGETCALDKEGLFIEGEIEDGEVAPKTIVEISTFMGIDNGVHRSDDCHIFETTAFLDFHKLQDFIEEMGAKSLFALFEAQVVNLPPEVYTVALLLEIEYFGTPQEGHFRILGKHDLKLQHAEA